MLLTAKGRGYGKKKKAIGFDLVSAFGKLNLTPPSNHGKTSVKGKDEDSECQKGDTLPRVEKVKREPLSLVSINTGPPGPLNNSKGRVSPSLSARDSTLAYETRITKNIEQHKSEASDAQPNATVERRTEPFSKAIQSSIANERPCRHGAEQTRPLEVQALLDIEEVDDGIQDFEKQAQDWAKHFEITKIGQGGYASIFRMQYPDDDALYSVWKLMPLKPRWGRGSRAEGQTFVDDAIIEVRLLNAMCLSPGFVPFAGARVLRGCFPQIFQAASDQWTEEHQGEDEVPTYSHDQLWLFIEMANAGLDLEHIIDKGLPSGPDLQEHPLTWFDTWDIFWGIVEALAHGEDHAQFEHRDLHSGNICVQYANSEKDEKRPDFGRPRFTRLEVTLIDYTLSRALVGPMPNTQTDADGDVKQREILANSMKDKAVFRQRSDNPLDESQFRTYRLMREMVIRSSKGCKTEPEKWQNFVPKTNVLWLSHILKVLASSTADPSKAENSTNSIKDCRKRASSNSHPQHQCSESLVRDALLSLLDCMDPKDCSSWTWRSAKDLCNTEWSLEGQDL